MNNRICRENLYLMHAGTQGPPNPSSLAAIGMRAGNIARSAVNTARSAASNYKTGLNAIKGAFDKAKYNAEYYLKNRAKWLVGGEYWKKKGEKLADYLHARRAARRMNDPNQYHGKDWSMADVRARQRDHAAREVNRLANEMKERNLAKSREYAARTGTNVGGRSSQNSMQIADRLYGNRVRR